MFDTKNQLGEEKKKGFTSALQSIQRTHLRPQQCPIDHVTHPFPSGSLRVKVNTVVEFQEQIWMSK